MGMSTTHLSPDAKSGAMWHVELTLSTAGTVTSVAVPNDATGFRLSQASAELRFAIDEDPPGSAAASSSTTVAVGDLGAGNILQASTDEVRLIEDGTGRELRLVGDAGSETVNVEFF